MGVGGAYCDLLCLSNLDNKKCHEAATRNCIPQGRLDKGPLCLSGLDARGCHKGAICNCVPQEGALNGFLIIYKRDMIIM